MAINREKGVRAVSVGDLLAEELRIPPYQRPYSWEPATALQLLDDIREAYRSRAETVDQGEAESSSKKSYVLGAVILHKDKDTGETNVVDGQQRLLTLLMILGILSDHLNGSVATDEDASSPVVLVRLRIDRSGQAHGRRPSRVGRLHSRQLRGHQGRDR